MSTFEQFAIAVPCSLIGAFLWLVLLNVGVLRWGWMDKFEGFMDWTEAVARKIARMK